MFVSHRLILVKTWSPSAEAHLKAKKNKSEVKLVWKKRILEKKTMWEDKTPVITDDGTVIPNTWKQVLLQLKRRSADLQQGEKTS